MNTDIKDMVFEDALKELELAVAHLETGDLSLEDALANFERGQALAAYCSHLLETASLRVEQLTTDGEILDLMSTEKSS